MMARSAQLTPVVHGDIGAALYRVAEEFAPRVLALAEEIAAVPAPTGDELRRSELVRSLMESLPFDQIETDEIGDVVGRMQGLSEQPRLLIAAHIDTVFPTTTPLNIRHDDHRSYGPGIGDNCVGIAAALLIPAMLEAAGLRPDVDLLITGNVGEEGLGNLRGMISVMDLHPETGAVIAVEGHNLGRVTHIAVGSMRYRITVSGPGGHSWGDFGKRNAIQAAADIISEMDQIELPASPKTTLNVGTIEGGTSVNTIAPSCTFLLDMRSVDADALTNLNAEVEGILHRKRKEISVTTELLGVRPAGQVAPNSRITRIASAILESMGITPTGDASSTDANIPISRGIPAVCIGLTTGGNVHKESEYIEREPVARGLYQLLGLTVSVAEELRFERLT
jgi:acetylornithine deacetylase/succinyl-diaminopimelate desuccinylase-like protein